MWDCTRQRKTSPTLAEIKPMTSGFYRSSLYRLSYKARREKVMGDYGGNCSNVNVKGTNVTLALQQMYCTTKLILIVSLVLEAQHSFYCLTEAWHLNLTWMHNFCLVHKALAFNVVGNQMTHVNHQKGFNGTEIAKKWLSLMSNYSWHSI